MRRTPTATDSELADDEATLASMLVAAITPSGVPDLVLCGDRSADRGTGALPAFLAHELHASQALGLVALDPGSPGTLVVERRLDAGWRERICVRLPAVCSVEGAGVRLRRASLAGALAVDRVPIRVDPSPAAAGAARHDTGPKAVHVGGTLPFTPRTRVVPPPESDDPRLRLSSLTGALVAHDPPTVVYPPDAAEAADVLLAFLARHGYIDTDATTGAVTAEGTA